jgi:trans-2,3-dihydro-3-hydroxyanthranilate isomerase
VDELARFTAAGTTPAGATPACSRGTPLAFPRDPATGSASGALGAYLIEQGLVAAGSTVDIVSEQGTRMGRQSFIQIRIATSAGRITEILVGGRVVPAIEGRLRVP